MNPIRTFLGIALVSAAVAVPLAVALAPEPLPPPALYPMPAFSLTSEQGEPFGAEKVAGKVVVANFIFTSCPTVCPTLTAHMKRLQDRFADRAGVHLLSFSVDPKNDTPEKLKEFGARFGQDPRRWTFLTGELAAIEAAVEQGFKIHMDGAGDPEATAFDIVHGEHFVLVDGKGTIRGYYQPNADDLERLADDVERLLEELRG